MKLKIVLEPSEGGGYAVHVPALRGCHTQGDTVEDALENAKDAIISYLEAAKSTAQSGIIYHGVNLSR